MSIIIKYINIILFISISITHTAANEASRLYGYSPTGHLKYPKNFSHFDYVNPNAPKGGKYIEGEVGTFDSLNPFTLKGNKLPNAGMLFDSLLTSSQDELLSKYGMLAESLELADNRRWVDFNLRKEAHWHDNTKITADDVVFTFYTLKEKGSIQYKIIYADISKAEALSKYKVRFYLNNQNNLLLISTIGEMPILSKKFFANKDFNEFTNKPILGSGPYKIKEFNFGDNIIYERVSNYWAKDLPTSKGMYNFDEIEYIYYKDENAAVAALKAGEYDLRDENLSKLWGTTYSIKPANEGKLIKASITHKLPANLQILYFNLRRPVFQDINLRKALTLAYDFDWMNKYLFYGIYKKTESYFHNSPYAATGLPHGRELAILTKFKGQIPKDVFTQIFATPKTNANETENRNNLRQAKRILLAAGYKINNGKLISPVTKKPVILEVIYNSQAFERIYAAYKNNLEKIGITLNLKQIDFAQHQKRLQDFDFDLMSAAWIPVLIPGVEQKQFWNSHSDTPGGYNLGGIHDKIIDNLTNMLSNTRDLDEITAISKALDRVLLWNYYALLTLHSNEFRYIYWNKFGMPTIRPDYSQGKETWWSKDLLK